MRIPAAPAKNLFVRETYRQTRKRYRRDLEPIEAMGHHPMLMAGMVGFELAAERSHRVDDRLKALAELKAALLVGCEFCIDIGSHLAARTGLTDEQLLAVPRHREATCFSDVERLVMDYAEAMTSTPVAVGEDLFARLREHFDDAQLVELTSMIAWENWRARVNWAFDIGPAGFREGMACPAPLAVDDAAEASAAA